MDREHKTVRLNWPLIALHIRPLNRPNPKMILIAYPIGFPYLATKASWAISGQGEELWR